jgi:hypothetical protein
MAGNIWSSGLWRCVLLQVITNIFTANRISDFQQLRKVFKSESYGKVTYKVESCGL